MLYRSTFITMLGLALNKILVLPIIAAFISIIAILPQDAHATTFTATVSGPWNSATTWGGASPPNAIGVGDIVTIPSGKTVTMKLGDPNVSNAGTINNQGTILISSSTVLTNTNIITNTGLINIRGTLVNNHLLTNTGNIKNDGTIINGHSGTINNNVGGTIINDGTISNSNIINNHGGTINNMVGALSTGAINNSGGTINNDSGGTITNSVGIIDNTGGTINNAHTCANISGPVVGNPVNNIACGASIPEFPFSYSLIVMFVAVAAVYMGIRQKMSLNFKKF